MAWIVDGCVNISESGATRRVRLVKFRKKNKVEGKLRAELWLRLLENGSHRMARQRICRRAFVALTLTTKKKKKKLPSRSKRRRRRRLGRHLTLIEVHLCLSLLQSRRQSPLKSYRAGPRHKARSSRVTILRKTSEK